MFKNVVSFINKHDSFLLTTHDSPDADGIGAQIVLSAILKAKGKTFRIINSTVIPSYLRFMDHESIIECWDNKKHSPLVSKYALIALDTSDEYHIGQMWDVIKSAKEMFILDHHEQGPHSNLPGFIDTSAASASELVVELASYMELELDPKTATAAYAGIVYDTGFFAYPKTSVRTFRNAIKTLEWGADPNFVYRQLMESASYQSLLLQKQALANLEFHARKKIAVMTLSKDDLLMTGAGYEEAESIVNIPLKAKEVEISMLIKEKPTGEIRCSMRSKGKVNVSKIAQEFGGGGHVTAAGFRSSLSMEKTLNKLLCILEEKLANV
ncbi:MAG: bifunctional oligoribonuclease/PAP phosphatase NrnA [Treponema sp.]|jgi:phosphoesterase RecJ-like protein|nr:bifunctional oligoribonuclease/PAP phosphatase NrnA [Treponema sp.]